MARFLSRVPVLVVLILCGLLVTTSALEADGTQLRNETSTLPDIIGHRSEQGEALQEEIAGLRESISGLQERAVGGDAQAEAAQARADRLETAASASALSGEGVTVTLDDAPSDALSIAGTRPNDLLIHQQDLEAVMNALWRGGAQGLAVQEQRIVATSSVRCVGNTLRINSRVFSPPYTISAVGDPVELQRALAESPELTVFRQYAERLGLGWKVETGPLELSAYVDSIDVSQAKVKD